MKLLLDKSSGRLDFGAAACGVGTTIAGSSLFTLEACTVNGAVLIVSCGAAAEACGISTALSISIPSGLAISF